MNTTGASQRPLLPELHTPETIPPNQDAVDYRLVKAGSSQVAVIAVADGAGSASRSDEGSQIAVKVAVESIVKGVKKKPPAAFTKHLATSLVRDAIKQAKNAVVRYGKEHGVSPRDLACTLIVAVASERLMTAAQLGDGAVVAFNIADGAAKTLCAANTGEYANETTFITSRTRPHQVADVGHASGSDYDALALNYRRAAKPGPHDAGARGVHGVLEPDAQRPGPDRRTRSRPR